MVVVFVIYNNSSGLLFDLVELKVFKYTFNFDIICNLVNTPYNYFQACHIFFKENI